MHRRPVRFVSIAAGFVFATLSSASPTASAATTVLSVGVEDKSRCRFVDFVDIKGAASEEAALQAAQARVRFLKGDGLYVRSQARSEKGVTLSGEALKCNP